MTGIHDAYTYTEGTLAQQMTAAHLEQQIEWKSVYAYNNEDIGSAIFLGGGTARRLYEYIIFIDADAQQVEVRLDEDSVVRNFRIAC